MIRSVVIDINDKQSPVRRMKSNQSAEDWKPALRAKPTWELKNRVKNPGEFVLEMRQAAAILAERADDQIK